MKKRFSVIMPTYNQSSFIRRAIKSLFNQIYQEWELIIINDGGTDETEEFIKDFLEDSRIVYLKNEENKGLGYAINQGLDIAKYEYISYLPSDDLYYENHLSAFYEEFQKAEDIILTFSGAKSEIKDSFLYNEKTTIGGLFKSASLQLVQVCHKRTEDRWVTREEWVSDNLFDLFWRKLIDKGIFTSIQQVTAEWTIHAFQHHHLVNEDNGGGLNRFRQYYNVKQPIKLKVSKYKFLDEVELYKNFRGLKVTSNEKESLKILLVGELAYNPDRFYALEEYGHKLYGLWINLPKCSFSTVGPLPFGNVSNVSYEDYEKQIREINPDIILGTLNYESVPLAYEVLRKVPDIPFVWHFKEGPFVCRREGTWEKLIYLYHHADGNIYLNKESKDWYEQFIPAKEMSFILDGDLPKIDFFTNDFSQKISESDGEIHTIAPGRTVGVTLEDIRLLAGKNIHLHLYVENYYKSRENFVEQALKIAPEYFHIHSNCPISQWVKEFSKYDAGWLHCFDSQNNGNLAIAGWNDLNMPARMSTLAAAGLPMIQKDNSHHVVAVQNCVREKGMGIFFKGIEDLAIQLKNKELMHELAQNVLEHRFSFSFDYHVPNLTAFLKKVIAIKKK